MLSCSGLCLVWSDTKGPRDGEAGSVVAGSVAVSALFCFCEFCLSIAPLNKSIFITSVSSCIIVPSKKTINCSRADSQLQQVCPLQPFISIPCLRTRSLCCSGAYILSSSFVRFVLMSTSLYVLSAVLEGGQATVFLLLEIRPPLPSPQAWGLGPDSFLSYYLALWSHSNTVPLS